MKTSHVVFASGTALAGGRAFVFSLSKLLFTQKKNPADQFELGFILTNLLSLGGPPSCVQSLRGVWVLSQGQKNGREAWKKEG